VNTMTIKLGTLEVELDAFRTAARTRQPTGSTVTFAAYDDFARVITSNRLRMLETLISSSVGLTVRALAEKLGRDIRAVHDDIKALEFYELLVNERGNIHVPYDDLHIDVHIRRAA